MEENKLMTKGPNANPDEFAADDLFAAADEYDEFKKAMAAAYAEEEANGDLDYTRASMNDLWVEDWEAEAAEYCDAPVDDTFGLDFDDLEESVDEHQGLADKIKEQPYKVSLEDDGDEIEGEVSFENGQFVIGLEIYHAYLDNNHENPDRHTDYVDGSYGSLDDLLNDTSIPKAVKEGLLDFGEPADGSSSELKTYDIGDNDGGYFGQVKAHNEDEAFDIASEIWPERVCVGHYLDKVCMQVQGEADPDEEELEEYNSWAENHSLDESVDLKKISYNRALGLADDNNKPVIYGYTVKGGAFKDVAPVVCDDVQKCTVDFQKAHPDYSVVYVAYPGGMQIDESFEIDFDKCLEAFNDFDDDVECCECHDMFHKGDCEKGEHGYVCKHCREMSEYYDREATADPESTVEPSKDVPVKDCPVNDVITHCEEENPDCEMKKPALEKPLTEDTDEIKLWSAEEVQRAIDEIL